MPVPEKIVAPFSSGQVRRLNRWQQRGIVHPFTCPNEGSKLVAHEDGWRCPNCAYRQNWAHACMLFDPPEEVL